MSFHFTIAHSSLLELARRKRRPDTHFSASNREHHSLTHKLPYSFVLRKSRDTDAAARHLGRRGPGRLSLGVSIEHRARGPLFRSEVGKIAPAQLDGRPRLQVAFRGGRSMCSSLARPVATVSPPAEERGRLSAASNPVPCLSVAITHSTDFRWQPTRRGWTKLGRLLANAHTNTGN